MHKYFSLVLILFFYIISFYMPLILGHKYTNIHAYVCRYVFTCIYKCIYIEICCRCCCRCQLFFCACLESANVFYWIYNLINIFFLMSLFCIIYICICMHIFSYKHTYSYIFFFILICMHIYRVMHASPSIAAYFSA